jgi:hypothetical protein
MRGRLLLLFILICFSSSLPLFAQQHSLKIHADFGVDRNISTFFNELADNQIPLPVEQVTSSMVNNLSFTLVRHLPMLDLHFTGGLITRRMHSLQRGGGSGGPIYNNQYFLGLGVGYTLMDRSPFALKFGTDILLSYQDRRADIFVGTITERGTFIEPYVRAETITFGAPTQRVVPMFAPLLEGSYALKNGHRILLGVGMVGQFYRSYSFEFQAIESRDNVLLEVSERSSRFSMFYPFLRMGMQF